MATTTTRKSVRTTKTSARKRARQYAKRHEQNVEMDSKMRNQIKKLKVALASKNKGEAEKLLKLTLPTIAKMASKRIIHRNTAARYTSRLMHIFNQL